MARAARESRQQARTIAYALARPLRGLAGRFELGAFRSIFLQVLLGESSWIARKRVRTKLQRCSARALGRLRWEPLVHFLSVSLGACVEKSVPKIRRKMF